MFSSGISLENNIYDIVSRIIIMLRIAMIYKYAVNRRYFENVNDNYLKYTIG